MSHSHVFPPMLVLQWTSDMAYYLWYQLKNIINTDIFEKLPGFYKEVVEIFIECNLDNTAFNGCIRDFCICGNENIVNNQKQSLYFPIWTESGIIRVSDIRFINETIDERDIFSCLQKKTNYISDIYQRKHAINALSNTAPKCIQHKCEHKMNVPNQK